jgi:hypothetical protein
MAESGGVARAEYDDFLLTDNVTSDLARATAWKKALRPEARATICYISTFFFHTSKSQKRVRARYLKRGLKN